MVKKTKNNPINSDRIETAQEIQFENMARLNELEKRFVETEEKLSTAENKLNATEDKFKRILADYHNQERRHKEQESQIIKMASASLLEKILLDLDALQMAQNHLKDKGLQMVIDKFFNTITQEGLIRIDSDGQNFDPITMDCTEVVPGEKNKVIETISAGYLLFDKVLRPAKVKVGSGSVLRVPEPNP